METQPARQLQPSARSASVLMLAVIILLFALGSMIQAFNFNLGLLLNQWVLILLPALYYIRRYSPFPEARARLKPLAPKYIPVIVLLVVSAWITLAFVESLLIGGLVELGFEPLEKIPAPETASQYAVYIFSVAVSAGVCEEVLFRGAIMPSVERHGLFPALLFSSVLFALIHMSFLNLVSTFILGLIIGLVVIKTGSLFAGILYHSLNNFIAISLMYGYSRYDLGGYLQQHESLYAALFPAAAVLGLAGTLGGLLLLQRQTAAKPLWRNRGGWLPRGWANWATALILLIFLVIAALELFIGFGWLF